MNERKEEGDEMEKGIEGISTPFSLFPFVPFLLS
jgi:hypothetical protein